MDFRKIIKPNWSNLNIKGNLIQESREYITNNFWIIRKNLLSEVEKAQIKEKATSWTELSEEQVNELQKNVETAENNSLEENIIYVDLYCPTLKAKNYPERYEFNAYFIAFILNKIEKFDIRYEIKTTNNPVPLIFFVESGTNNVLGAVVGIKNNR
jgi:hypothetical protein